MEANSLEEKDSYQVVGQATLEEMSLLLENRSFIDYFNIFLGLPVFGQHVFYNYVEMEFEFEPPIRKRRHLFLDQREVLKWLCKERFLLFKHSPLYTEYLLCNQLKNTPVDIHGMKREDEKHEGVDVNTFCRNLIGNATGMLMFRESMRGTCGGSVYRCWKDIQAWSLLSDNVTRMYWKRVIKTKYIYQNSASQLNGRMKLVAFRGYLNFDVIPDQAVQDELFNDLMKDDGIFTLESDQGLEQLQVVLMEAMKRYWLPRYLLHIEHSSPEADIAILKRPAPGDLGYLSHERRLRCRFMFPTIYQDSLVSTPTTVFTSRSVGDVPTQTPTSEYDDEDEEEDEEEETIKVEHKDLLSMWGGPTKDVDVQSCSSSSQSSVSEADSPDLFNKRRLHNDFISPVKVTQSPIPLFLTSYLGGKKRTLLGKCPPMSNRIIWSLASDVFASNPFRNFLYRNGYVLDLHYMSFWQEVRTYLDTDDTTLDSLGHPLRKLLAHRISATYLTYRGEGSDIFSESLKTSLHQALVNHNDVSLLCMAQDIVLDGLWGPLKNYIEDERRRFLKQVRGNRYYMDFKKRREADKLVRASRPASRNIGGVDPVYFYQCAAIESSSTSSRSPPIGISPTIPRDSENVSRAATSYHISIPEEQMWKAMELAVLCCEYGTTMMLPQNKPTAKQLVDVLHSDYGSLHVNRVPVKRQEWLRNIVSPPKINIETIRVSRKVILDKLDLSHDKDKDTGAESRHRNRLLYRRNGMVLERPTKPKSFVEVLTIPAHFDFFKRFMVVQKMGMPLMFWKGIEDMKALSNPKTRQIRVSQIVKKFFGKYAKFGALLDCHEEIIRQIPNMEKVTPGILICAQAAVYRSMERKWYPLYLETYPPESESSSSGTSIIQTIQPKTMAPELFDVISVSKRPKKRVHVAKTLLLWRAFTRALAAFHRSLQKPSEVQLLDIFLRCEVEKEQFQNVHKEGTGQIHSQIEKNIQSSLTANLQTRVVIRNRLVILNRLTADMRFWKEVEKYQWLVDSAMKAETVTAQDTEFLIDKARAVISCFLASEVSPRVQVNVPNDMALGIINTLAMSGPIRGLFHDAMVLLFPLLYHYWKKCFDEWIKGKIPEEMLDFIEKTARNRVSSVPHVDQKDKDYTTIKTNEMKTIIQQSYDEFAMKIHFSILDGVIIIYPQQKQHKMSEHGAGARRMTKQSMLGLPELSSASPRKESKLQVNEKKDGRRSARSDRHKDDKHTPPKDKPTSPKDKHKRKKRTLLKEVPEERSSTTTTNSSVERTRRLSQLVVDINTEREEKMKANPRFTKMLKFDDIVSAAIQLPGS